MDVKASHTRLRTGNTGPLSDIASLERGKRVKLECFTTDSVGREGTHYTYEGHHIQPRYDLETSPLKRFSTIWPRHQPVRDVKTLKCDDSGSLETPSHQNPNRDTT